MCILVVCIIGVWRCTATIYGRPQVKVRILYNVFLLTFREEV